MPFWKKSIKNSFVFFKIDAHILANFWTWTRFEAEESGLLHFLASCFDSELSTSYPYWWNFQNVADKLVFRYDGDFLKADEILRWLQNFSSKLDFKNRMEVT